MKNLSKIAGIALLSLTTSTWVSAQEKDNKGKNPDSVRPLDESNIMWKQRLWRRMDLNEKQNQPFFSKGNEITKYLIEWVQSGVLQPYKTDSLKTKITKEEFLKNLAMENIGNDNALSDAEKAAGFGTEAGGTKADDGWGDPKPKTPTTGLVAGTPPVNDGFNNPTPVSTGSELYYAKQLSILFCSYPDSKKWMIDNKKNIILLIQLKSAKTELLWIKHLQSFKAFWKLIN